MNHMRPSLPRLLAVLLVFMALAMGACHEPPPADLAQENHTAPAMAAMAESYHELADVAVESGDLDGAAQAMRDLVDSLGGSERAESATRELGMDALGRLGRILIDQDRQDEALIVADQGLAFGGDLSESSSVAGYLHQLRGDVLRSAGDDRGAVEAHKAAIMVFKHILETHADTTPGAP